MIERSYNREVRELSVGLNLAEQDVEPYLVFWCDMASKYHFTLELVNYLNGDNRVFNTDCSRTLRLIYPHPIDLIFLNKSSEVSINDLLCDYLLNYNSQINTSILLNYRRYMQVYDVDTRKDQNLNRTRAIANIILNTNGWSD